MPPFRERGLAVDLSGELAPHLPPLFAMRPLERGHDIRTVQEILGDRHVTTTMSYTHLLQYGARGVCSPLGQV